MAQKAEIANHGGGSLGIYAKIASPTKPCGYSTPENIDPETGEIHGQPRDSRTARAERFALKSFAARLLPKDSRLSKCMNWTIPNRQVDVKRVSSMVPGAAQKEEHKAFYQGLEVCGSVHLCPVCSAKIAERRRAEIAGVIATAKASGLSVNLLTLTIPHGIGDDLGENVDRLLKAYRRLFSGVSGQKIKTILGIEGTIRALEVTHGENGFHPHFHVLLFMANNITTHQAWELLAPRWQQVATACGLPAPSLQHGCRVDGGDRAARYVSKGSTWGLESEITKGHLKVARSAKGRTPFQLLRDYGEGVKKAGALFLVYAQVFQGKRQLVWSKGLKKRFAVPDWTDEELAQAPDDTPSVHLSTITAPQWVAIRKKRFQSLVLDLAEVSPDALREFLEALPVTVTTEKIP